MYPRGRPGGAKHRIAVCLLALFGLLSCGLETFYYIDNIPFSDYRDETHSSVRLPSSGNEGYGGENDYFTRFIIFYRIYLSATGTTGRLDTQLTRPDGSANINSALAWDYSRLYNYTDPMSTTVSTTDLDRTFYGYKYFKLELEGENIDNVLGKASLGRTLEIDFSIFAGQVPSLSIDGGTPYTLQRANSGPSIDFAPLPTDRYFFNHPELYNTENANSDINADVASTTEVGVIQYTYVSMYIAAVGRSFEMPPKTIYSQPTFLGIFRLPNR